MALSYGIYALYNDAAREGKATRTGREGTRYARHLPYQVHKIKSMSIKGPLRHLRKRRGTPRRYNLRELGVMDKING